MAMVVKPRFPDCLQCRFFSRTRPNNRCLPCGSGEFFEEKITDREPTADELMRIYARMNHDDQD
jgi:hypothetical protein